jgi:Family of unknown function (DUF6519)
MTLDISRWPYDAWNDYLGVVMQQGRVHLDSDWNELLAEFTRRIHAGSLDVLGLAGVPSTTPGAFQIQITPPDAQGNLHATIGVGRIYVDGILAENHGSPSAPQWDPILADYFGSPTTPLDYANQPYVRGAVFPANATGQFLVYLDVWQREVSYIEDPSLVDQAVGVDTTGRLQTVWQVKLLDVSAVAGGFAGSTPDAAVWTTTPAIASGPIWQTLIQGSPSLLTNGPAQGYVGQENQLYRVQIHQGGAAASASTLPVTYPLTAGTATFKWSRENASVATAVTAIASVTNSLGNPASQLTVQSLGRDQVLGFSPGDWIEIIDDFLELSAAQTQSGELHQIDSINAAALTIVLDAPVSAGNFPVTSGLTDPARHTRIRRWDQGGTVYFADGQTAWANLAGSGSAGIPVPPSGTVLQLENGITVAFDLSTAGNFQSGDYWTFATRIADGSVAPLSKAFPAGTNHHVCRLAIVDFSFSPPAVTDCRTVFQPLASPSIHVTGINPVSGVQLVAGGTINIQDLEQGINVSFDSPLDSAITTATIAPVCFITVEVPDSTNGWCTPMTLVGTASVATPSVVRSITWIPSPKAIGALTTLIPAAQLPVLARLTLKGNSIWALGGPPYVYLNGAGIGDGRSYADFEMCFWLNSEPPVDVSATALTFSAQTAGTISDPQPITLTNNSGEELDFTDSGISVVGPNAADFIMTNTCGTELDNAASCSISVQFSPTLTLALTPTRSASIAIAANIDAPTISLTGTALTPQLTVSSDSLGYPATVVGRTTYLTVGVSNTGNAPLSISLIQISGAGDFAQTSNCVPPLGGGTLQPGQQCTVTVGFTPIVTGPRSAVLIITHNAFNGSLQIPLSGSGIVQPIKVIEVKVTDFKTLDNVKTFEVKVTDIIRNVTPIRVLGTVGAKPSAAGLKSFITPKERPAVSPPATRKPAARKAAAHKEAARKPAPRKPAPGKAASAKPAAKRKKRPKSR